MYSNKATVDVIQNAQQDASVGDHIFDFLNSHDANKLYLNSTLLYHK